MRIVSRQPSALQRALERARDPQILSLALGLPAPEMFPGDDLVEAAVEKMRESRTSLQYGAPEQKMKGYIVELMRLRGVACEADEILLTSGAQQALSLLAQVLLPGSSNAVMVEAALYPGFRQAIEAFGSELISVPIDPSHGIDAGAAERALQSKPRPAFLYTISAGHNPLSLTMNQETRHALIEISLRHDLPIVEDDVYGFLQYDGHLEPPLRALDGQRVFYVGSFSKILAPAFRIGWIVAPRSIMATLSVLKEGSDINTATFAQRLVCQYLDSHSLPSHIERLRSEYRSRRDAMQHALLECFPTGVRWKKPSAGFFFWVESELFGDTEELLEEALQKRVAFVPGGAFAVSPDQHYRHAVRLNFSHCSAVRIHEAVQRIACAVQDLNARVTTAAS